MDSMDDLRCLDNTDACFIRTSHLVTLHLHLPTYSLHPTGDIFDQPLLGGMSWIRGKIADHVGDHVVLSPEEGVLVTSPGTEMSYPRPPQSLNNS